MVQGIFGGCTSYKIQPLPNILEDIDAWIKYTEETKACVIKNKTEMESSAFWNHIPWNFRMTIETTIAYFETILYDLNLVRTSLSTNCVTNREVKLLESIGKKSREYNHEYGRHYNEGDRWKEYGNPDFAVVEQVYAKGRDFFITLQDAVNAAARLEDYMQHGVINNSINISGNVSHTQIQQNVTNSAQTMVVDDYDKILEVLEKIERSCKYEDFDDAFGAAAGNFKQTLDELIAMTKEQKEPGKIKQYLQILQDIVSKTASSVIANGIAGMIQSLIKQ